MTTPNGAASDLARRRKVARGGPVGTPFQPWEYARLFTGYAGGTVLDTEWDVRKVEKLIETDPTSRKNEAVLGQPIRSAPWQILNAPGDAGEGDYCRAVMSRLMQGLINRCSNGFSLRKAYHELCWGLDNGKAVLDDIAWRPTATCQQAWTPAGEMDGFWQQVGNWTTRGRGPWGSQPGEDSRFPGWKRIEQARSFVYIHGRHRQPIRGVSDLDISLNLYEQRRKLTFLLFQFLELQSVPRVGAGGRTPTKADNRADALFEAKAGGIVPVDLEGEERLADVFHVIESGGKGIDQFLATIKWLQQEATNSILAGFTDLTAHAGSGRGSYALSADQSRFFLENRQAVADELADQIATGVLRPLCQLNFGADAAIPAVTIGPISEAHIERALDLMKSLIVSPQVNAPDGFVDMLIIQTAQFLGLSADEVRTMVDDHRAEREAKQAAARLQGEVKAGSAGTGGAASASAAGDSGSAGLAAAIALSHELVTRAHAGEDPADALGHMKARIVASQPAPAAPSLHRRRERNAGPRGTLPEDSRSGDDVDGELALARHVRTEAGVKRYGLPIGSPIGGDNHSIAGAARGADHIAQDRDTPDTQLAHAVQRAAVTGRKHYVITHDDGTTDVVARRGHLAEGAEFHAVHRDGTVVRHDTGGALHVVSGAELHDRVGHRLGDPSVPEGSLADKLGRVRKLKDPELDDAMNRSIETDNMDAFERFAAESDRRDTARSKRAEAKTRQEEARAAEYERLLDAGAGDEEAVEKAYGVPVERQRRDRAIAMLRGQGYTGPGLDSLARQAYRDHIYQQWQDAEDATRGAMLNPRAKRLGVDDRALFQGSESYARKHASEELLQWWDENGRLTYNEWLADLLGDPSSSKSYRSQRQDFYR